MTNYFNKTLKYTLVAGLACAGAFLPLVSAGLWLPFAGGVAGGVCAAMLNMLMAWRMMDRAVNTGNRKLMPLCFGLRCIVYASVLVGFLALGGTFGALGAAAGCLTGPLATLLAGAVEPALKRKLRLRKGLSPDEEMFEYVYEEHLRREDGSLRYVFVRGHSMARYAGGRSFVTHRRFRRIKEIRGVQDTRRVNASRKG
jgi:hypothetical protein